MTVDDSSLSEQQQQPAPAMTPELKRELEKSNGKGKWFVLLAGLVAVGAFWASRQIVGKSSSSIPSIQVQQEEFVISLILRGGELEAVKAENVVAPQVRGQLKVVELFPEGEQADIGDLLVQFELTEFERRVTDAEQELEAAQADLEKTLATQRSEISRLEGDIKDQEANLRLAELQVERMAFEATAERERVQIEARRASLNHQQAVDKLESQKIVDNAEVRQRELEISRKERDLARARRELESLTIKAEKPGLVVYGRVWRGSGWEKVRVGDDVWGGVNVVSLPDLTRMQVKTAVNEVDVDKISVGQETFIKLDALPEPTFHGKVVNIASLGREKEGERHVKVFDVVVEIDEEDRRLRPGMTATSTVIIETIPPRPAARPDSLIRPADQEVVAATEPLPLYIPLDAVFERDGKTVVYRLDSGSPQATEVRLGKRNDNYVIVEEGLNPDDRVALRDPSLTTGDLGSMARTTPSTPSSPQGP